MAEVNKMTRFKTKLNIMWGNIKFSLRRLVKNKKTLFGAIILFFFFFIALFGDKIVNYDDTINYDKKFLPPSAQHWLGTDNMGRDLLSQLIYGAKDVLQIALYTGLVTIVIGVVLGLVSGLMGGLVDKTIMFITNVFMSVPGFPVMMVLASLITIDNNLVFALILSIWSWTGLARAIRAQVLSLKERDFIQVCKVMGLKKTHILFKEVLPNMSSFIAINFVYIMRSAIIGSAGLMFLGIAVFEPSNWGAMLLRAKDTGAILVPGAQLFFFAPMICILLFQLGAMLFANGLDELINPRLR